MPDEKPEVGLVIRAAKTRELDMRPRVNGVLVHRMERLRSLMEAQLMRDAAELGLARYCFLEDDELKAVRVTTRGRPLTARERQVVRKLEMCKKEAPIALQFAHDRLVNAQRAQQEQKSLSINVERAVIRVPDTKQDAIEDAVIIEGEVRGGV